MFNNTAILLDFRSGGEKDINITLDMPRAAVKGSQRVYVSAIADPVGPAMNNLKELLRSPTGSGEQNMLRMVPAVIVADYLEENAQFQGSLEHMARHLMEDGYQRQLAYKLSDGSFSAFGPIDRRGSMWVTALVARYFRRATTFVDVDEDVIHKALYWIVEKQANNGSFAEIGKVTYQRIQEDPTALTAFVSLAFLDNRFSLDATLLNAMNRGISYLAEAWGDLEDPYVLSIICYVLHLADHPQKDSIFAVLDSLAIKKDDKKWWEVPLEGFEKANPWTALPNSANIEMTSYGLLTALARNQFDDSIPIVNWLLSQQNENGGFASSPDTFVATHALVEFSSKLNVPNRGTDINVQYSYLQTVRRLQVKSETSTIMHKRILAPETREIRLRASGGGIAVVQVGYQYNFKVTSAWPSFVVNPQVFKPSTANNMQVSVCVNYIQGGDARASNLAVMEVNLPSGFTANMDTLPALRRYKGVKRVETQKQDTKFVLYFENLSRAEVCPTISAYRTHRVANQKPAAVLVYDYYDQSRKARAFYDVVPATLCDICQGDDCPDDGCPDRPIFQNYGSYAFGANVDTDSGATGSSVIGVSVDVLVLSVLCFYALFK